MNVDADVAAIGRLAPGSTASVDAVEVTGPASVAASAFEVDRALAAAASYAIVAVDLVGRDNAVTTPHRVLDLEHLLAFCTTHVEVDGEAVPGWADLSGVYETADGRHLQIHCNFDHHAAGVVHRLGCEATRESVAAAIAERDPFVLEAELVGDGMIGAVVRTLEEWSIHPHAAATAALPLIGTTRLGDGAPRPPAAAGSPEHPLTGLKVLDCSRVLAGPVAGQMLAGSGADVMRLGAERLPSVPIGVMATGFGKRNAFADVATDAGRAAMWKLLEAADVWIDAYRPGALAGHGFTPERVAERCPGIVIVQICAFDWTGPWAGRRGFDSIVQSTTGVRAVGGECAVDDAGRPLAGGPVGLPVQALDYATGFLAAGMAAQLIGHQRCDGGSWLAQLSLLRTRNWLVGLGGPVPFVPSPVPVDERFLATIDSEFGRLRTVRPLVGSWPSAPMRLGTSAPVW